MGGLTVKKTFVTFRGRCSKEENKSVREQNDEFKHNKKIMSCVQQRRTNEVQILVISESIF